MGSKLSRNYILKRDSVLPLHNCSSTSSRLEHCPVQLGIDSFLPIDQSSCIMDNELFNQDFPRKTSPIHTPNNKVTMLHMNGDLKRKDLRTVMKSVYATLGESSEVVRIKMSIQKKDYLTKQETPEAKQRRSFTSPKEVLRHYRKHRDRIGSKRARRESARTSSTASGDGPTRVHFDFEHDAVASSPATPAVVEEERDSRGRAPFTCDENRIRRRRQVDDRYPPPPYFQACPITSTPLASSPSPCSPLGVVGATGAGGHRQRRDATVAGNCWSHKRSHASPAEAAGGRRASRGEGFIPPTTSMTPQMRGSGNFQAENPQPVLLKKDNITEAVVPNSQKTSNQMVREWLNSIETIIYGDENSEKQLLNVVHHHHHHHYYPIVNGTTFV